MTFAKPILSLSQIVQMNVGFLGLQFSFGLQQSNMGPIYSYLGANEAELPILSLAGPLTGLLVQPIVGAMSDRTTSRFGRRTPYFLIGAIFCSLALLAMPYSSALWMAASLLWILDAANNVTMEPYRAYVGDRLDESQHSLGFLCQAAFTGLAQTLSYLAPSILVYWLGFDKDAVDENNIPHITKIAFMIGAVLSLSTILFSILRVKELPLSEAQLQEMRKEKVSVSTTLRDIWTAIREMPSAMRQLWWMMLFVWYGLSTYWQYIAYSLARSLYDTNDPTSQGFRDAVLINGQIGGFYNAVAFVAAFALVPFAKRFGPKWVHAACMVVAGLCMMVLPSIRDQWLLFLPMIGIGLGWASLMGNPYVMLAGAVPPERTGIYMGIFNMFIVIPMLINAATLPFYYNSWLGGDSRNAILLAGALMALGGVATLWVKVAPRSDVPAGAARGAGGH
jgi:maltose/moltooligosaccharide transporter